MFFVLKNNNTDLWTDDYSLEAISENDWNISIKPSTNIDNLGAGESIEINITVYVPKNTVSFSFPMRKLVSMIDNMDESFLITDTWKHIQKRI